MELSKRAEALATAAKEGAAQVGGGGVCGRAVRMLGLGQQVTLVVAVSYGRCYVVVVSYDVA